MTHSSEIHNNYNAYIRSCQETGSEPMGFSEWQQMDREDLR